MAVAEAHPSIAELAAFALGTLGQKTHVAIEAHVAACPSCQERAAVVPGDSFVKLLCSAHAHTGRQPDTVTEGAAQVPTPRPLSIAAGEPITTASAAPAESGMLEAADVLPPELTRHERYHIRRLLGEGGMGAVYEAEHRVMQRPVALKVINRAYTANPAAVERFRREVRAAARLSHPNIVTTHDAEDAGDSHFLVMEYVEGVSLARRVKERGPLPVAEACDYVRQAALGLQHAHERGMVHRDVKPGNLILCPDGTVKLLDFGLAMLTAERGGSLTDTNVIMGTPDFMAPEQAENPRTADGRADVYGLGCTLYYLLTGRVPYPAETSLLKLLAHREQPLPSIRAVRPEVPKELEAVLARLLAKTPEDRYQTPSEVAAALVTFAQPAPVPPRKQWRWLVAAVAALLLAGITAAGAAVYRIQTDKGELVITTESDDVKVVITQGGELVDVIDTKTDKQIRLALRSGAYELELEGAHKGLKLDISKVTVTRGEKVLAKIERVEMQPSEKVGEVRRFERHTGTVRAVFSPDGRYVLSGEDWPTLNPHVRLWDVAAGKEIRQWTTTRVRWLAFSPDGRRALVGVSAGVIHLVDVVTGREIHQLVGHGEAVPSVAFSPDGCQVLSAGGFDATVRLWDANTGKEIRQFLGHTTQVLTAVFSPDGKRGLSGSRDKTIRVWDVATGQQLKSFGEGHEGGVHSVAFSPDGRYVLSGSFEEPQLRLWDVSTGKQVRQFRGHEKPVLTVAISHDGCRALSAGNDTTVRLWDVATGKELHCFKGHTDTVYSVAFSPDDRYALSGGQDLTLRLWRLPDPPEAKDKP
jgi:WD40 repeat protein